MHTGFSVGCCFDAGSIARVRMKWWNRPNELLTCGKVTMARVMRMVAKSNRDECGEMKVGELREQVWRGARKDEETVVVL